MRDGFLQPIPRPKGKYISPSQLKQLRQILESCSDWEEEILERLNISSIEQIPCNMADYCIQYGRRINLIRYG